jgi:hypothetical protein
LLLLQPAYLGEVGVSPAAEGIFAASLNQRELPVGGEQNNNNNERDRER